MTRRTGPLTRRLLKRMAEEDDAFREMTWCQWVPVWLGGSAFVFLGTIGRARYASSPGTKPSLVASAELAS